MEASIRCPTLINAKIHWLSNEIVREIKKLQPVIVYQQPENFLNVILTTFSDASFNMSSLRSYGQNGLISGLRIMCRDGTEVFHTPDRVSTKQRRISNSRYGAKILASAQGDDRGYYLKIKLRSLFPKAGIRNEVAVDSMGLYGTIVTLHEGNEYILRQSVQKI